MYNRSVFEAKEEEVPVANAFLGAVVGLGVITKIALDIQPTFLMRQYV